MNSILTKLIFPLHPLANTIQEQVVIPDRKISEILFQIDSRSVSPAVRHFRGQPGCGKTHLCHVLAKAFDAPVLEMDKNLLLSVQQKLLEFKRLEFSRRKFVIINEVDENHRKLI